MGSKILMRLEATSNKEIMEKYGCKRQEIGDQVMEEFRPLVPSRLDQLEDHFLQYIQLLEKQSLKMEKSYIRR